MNANIREFIRPTYNFFKDTIDIKSNLILKKNSELQDCYKGKKCFLLLTGESINHINLAKLKNQITFGANWSFAMPEILDIKPTFYLGTMFNERAYYSEDTRSNYWPKGWTPTITHNTIKEKLINCGTRVFFKADDFRYIKNNWEYDLNNENLFFIKTKKGFSNTGPNEVNLDKRFSVFEGGGCVYTSLIMIMHMGFKKIYLCGAGYTYNPQYVLHFYDNIIFPKSLGESEATICIKSEIEKRRNKGSTIEYYGVMQDSENYRAICVQKRANKNFYSRHHSIKEYAKRNNIKIYNIVPDKFESPVYDKLSWDEVQDNVLN